MCAGRPNGQGDLASSLSTAAVFITITSSARIEKLIFGCSIGGNQLSPILHPTLLLAMFKKIICLIVVAIISPVVVNFVVSIPKIYNYPIAGETNAWIGYWASIMGGLLSVVVAYVVLKYTIVENRKLLKTELQQQKIEWLKSDIARHLTVIKFQNIVSVDMVLSGLNKIEEQRRLDGFYETLSIYGNEIKLIYDEEETIDRTMPKLKFVDLYLKCIKTICDDIQELTVLMNEATNDSYKQELNSFYERHIKPHQGLQKEVFDAAKHFIQTEEEKLTNIL